MPIPWSAGPSRTTRSSPASAAARWAWSTRPATRKLGRLVALKFLPQQWSHDETAKQRFVREAQAASATHHPNICTIHDIETAADGQLFIVMAFYEGPTLKQRLESGPIAIDEALEIATQIADGLAKAHAQGVVHRDIKPGNVILTEDGVRILDFGLATFVDALQADGGERELRHAGVHVARAGAGADDGCALGRLGGRRRSLRDAVRARAIPGLACRGDRARDPPRGAGRRCAASGPRCPRRSSSSCSARCTRTRPSASRADASWRERCVRSEGCPCHSNCARHLSWRP